jgi:hypothetical protein
MSSSKPTHQTQPISLEEFQAGYLKPLPHSQDEVSYVIIRYVSKKEEEITPTQKEGLERFKRAGSLNLGQPENLHDL